MIPAIYNAKFPCSDQYLYEASTVPYKFDHIYSVQCIPYKFMVESTTHTYLHNIIERGKKKAKRL